MYYFYYIPLIVNVLVLLFCAFLSLKQNNDSVKRMEEDGLGHDSIYEYNKLKNEKLRVIIQSAVLIALSCVPVINLFVTAAMVAGAIEMLTDMSKNNYRISLEDALSNIEQRKVKK